jgi:shikimate kinase
VQRIYLTGFMGAGKSAAGKRLAEELDWGFVDLDQRIEERSGLTVAELFDLRGEEGFRRLERAELDATLVRERLVVATGGGTVAQPGVLEALRGQGLVVWLKPSFAELAARVEARGVERRPLFQDRDRAQQLYRERLPFYRQAEVVLVVDGAETESDVVRRLMIELGVEACAT